MRNLKRALSLGLASSMMLGTAAFGVSAKDYNDQDKISNQRAVDLVSAIGLMEGDHVGNFNPTETVTRAQMAVICTTMLNGANFHVSQFVGTDAFTDVPDWASDYVNLAHSLGIVDGYGNGIFGPNDPVTTVQAMTMLLKTLGYFQNASEFGDNYELAVTSKGTSLNLYNPDEDGVLEARQELTRENVASLAFRALTDVVQVDYNATFQAYYNYGSSMTHGVDNSQTQDTLGFKNFKELAGHEGYDEFDRPSITWIHDGQEIDTYTVEADYTFTEQKTVKEIYNAIGSNILNQGDDIYTRAIYIDGEVLDGDYISEEFTDSDKNAFTKITSDTTTKDGMLELLNNTDVTPFLETGAGVLTQIYVISPEYDSNKNLVNKGEIIISMVHTYLAEVVYVTDNGDDYTVNVNYLHKDPTAITQNAITDNTKFEHTFDTKKAFEKGDFVMITAAETSAQKMQIVTMELPTVVDGMATGSRIEPSVVGGSWLEVDGERFEYAHSVRGNITDDQEMAPTEHTEIKVFLDDYGLVLGYEAMTPDIQYLYIEDKDEGALMGGSRIRATFADGTEKIITVTYIDDTPVSTSNWNQIPTTSVFVDDDGNSGSANENVINTADNLVNYYNESAATDGKDIENVYLQNRIYGYVELSDGTYKLTTEIRKAYDEEEGTGVLPGISVDGNGYRYSNTYTPEGGTAQSGELGLPIETNSVHVATPQEGSMFIFTSVRYDFETSEKTDWDYDQFISIHNDNNGHAATSRTDGEYVFGIEKGYAGVSGAGYSIEANSFNERVHDNELLYPAYETISPSFNRTSANHVFLVDNQTVFIDVVNNAEPWVGYKNVPDMMQGDLNMQVVFGDGGIADVVFINHGAPTWNDGDYFIVLDNQADWALVDGVNTYTYDVYINGVETQITKKDSELKDQDGKKLNNNNLYFVTNQDDDYVYNVDHLYEYDKYANAAFTTGIKLDDENRYVSGVSHVGDGVLVMAEDEWFDSGKGGDGNTVGSFNGSQFYGDDNYVAEDAFSYDSSTNFIVLTANGVTTQDNSSKYSIRVGDASDIQTVNSSSFVQPSWVDVIVGSVNDDRSTPYAKTVVIINPYVTDAVVAVPKLENCYIAVEAADGNGEQNDPYILEGWMDIQDEYTAAQLLAAYKTTDTSDFVIAIVRQFCKQRGFVMDSTFEIVNYGLGNSWTGSDTGTWNVEVNGVIQKSDGEYEEEYVYLSLEFDDAFYGGITHDQFVVLDYRPGLMPAYDKVVNQYGLYKKWYYDDELFISQYEVEAGATTDGDQWNYLYGRLNLSEVQLAALKNDYLQDSASFVKTLVETHVQSLYLNDDANVTTDDFSVKLYSNGASAPSLKTASGSSVSLAKSAYNWEGIFYAVVTDDKTGKVIKNIIVDLREDKLTDKSSSKMYATDYNHADLDQMFIFNVYNRVEDLGLDFSNLEKYGSGNGSTRENPIVIAGEIEVNGTFNPFTETSEIVLEIVKDFASQWNIVATNYELVGGNYVGATAADEWIVRVDGTYGTGGTLVSTYYQVEFAVNDALTGEIAAWEAAVTELAANKNTDLTTNLEAAVKNTYAAIGTATEESGGNQKVWFNKLANTAQPTGVVVVLDNDADYGARIAYGEFTNVSSDVIVEAAANYAGTAIHLTGLISEPLLDTEAKKNTAADELLQAYGRALAAKYSDAETSYTYTFQESSSVISTDMIPEAGYTYSKSMNAIFYYEDIDAGVTKSFTVTINLDVIINTRVQLTDAEAAALMNTSFSLGGTLTATGNTVQLEKASASSASAINVDAITSTMSIDSDTDAPVITMSAVDAAGTAVSISEGNMDDAVLDLFDDYLDTLPTIAGYDAVPSAIYSEDDGTTLARTAYAPTKTFTMVVTYLGADDYFTITLTMEIKVDTGLKTIGTVNVFGKTAYVSSSLSSYTYGSLVDSTGKALLSSTQYYFDSESDDYVCTADTIVLNASTGLATVTIADVAYYKNTEVLAFAGAATANTAYKVTGDTALLNGEDADYLAKGAQGTYEVTFAAGTDRNTVLAVNPGSFTLVSAVNGDDNLLAGNSVSLTGLTTDTGVNVTKATDVTLTFKVPTTLTAKDLVAPTFSVSYTAPAAISTLSAMIDEDVINASYVISASDDDGVSAFDDLLETLSRIVPFIEVAVAADVTLEEDITVAAGTTLVVNNEATLTNTDEEIVIILEKGASLIVTEGTLALVEGTVVDENGEVIVADEDGNYYA